MLSSYTSQTNWVQSFCNDCDLSFLFGWKPWAISVIPRKNVTIWWSAIICFFLALPCKRRETTNRFHVNSFGRQTCSNYYAHTCYWFIQNFNVCLCIISRCCRKIDFQFEYHFALCFCFANAGTCFCFLCVLLFRFFNYSCLCCFSKMYSIASVVNESVPIIILHKHSTFFIFA